MRVCGVLSYVICYVLLRCMESTHLREVSCQGAYTRCTGTGTHTHVAVQTNIHAACFSTVLDSSTVEQSVLHPLVPYVQVTIACMRLTVRYMHIQTLAWHMQAARIPRLRRFVRHGRCGQPCRRLGRTYHVLLLYNFNCDVHSRRHVQQPSQKAVLARASAGCTLTC